METLMKNLGLTLVLLAAIASPMAFASDNLFVGT
jgi:hypothetical protein